MNAKRQPTHLRIQQHAAPRGKRRKAAFARIDDVLDKAAKVMNALPDEEFDQAIDEAMDHIRKRKA